MNNLQPIFRIETLLEGDIHPGVPMLSLPQVTPAQVIAKQQHSYEVNTLLQQRTLQMTPFPQTPMTTPFAQPSMIQVLALEEQQDPYPTFLSSGQGVPLPVARFDFSRSLRSGVTYIPRSMVRHKEPSMIDALIACMILIIIGLVLLTILYYFGL